jgi:hypothetical protein
MTCDGCFGAPRGAPGGVVGLLGAVPGGPPWKRKAVPLTGPALMRKGAPKPETTLAPANDDRKPAIVTVSEKKRVAKADRPAIEH